MTEQPLTEVIIDTPGPTITIKAAERLDVVLAAALKAYDHTRDHPRPEPQPGLAHGVGFQGELRDTPPAQPSGMAWAPGQYPIQNEGGTE